ncbi:MAG: hypothetical protein BWY66_00232 [bacterium ADurb.Bin374]|nr:MAG: hypothetical protein BWY66_00232 [bacterium ADurb.Bin374]
MHVGRHLAALQEFRQDLDRFLSVGLRVIQQTPIPFIQSGRIEILERFCFGSGRAAFGAFADLLRLRGGGEFGGLATLSPFLCLGGEPRARPGIELGLFDSFLRFDSQRRRQPHRSPEESDRIDRVVQGQICLAHGQRGFRDMPALRIPAQKRLKDRKATPGVSRGQIQAPKAIQGGLHIRIKRRGERGGFFVKPDRLRDRLFDTICYISKSQQTCELRRSRARFGKPFEHGTRLRRVVPVERSADVVGEPPPDLVGQIRLGNFAGETL